MAWLSITSTPAARPLNCRFCQKQFFGGTFIGTLLFCEGIVFADSIYKNISYEAFRAHSKSESKSVSLNIFNSLEDPKEEMPPPPGYILQLLHTLFIAHNGTLSSAPLQSRHRPHLHQHYQLHLHSFGLSRLNIYQTSELTTECIFQCSKKKK